jgi:hypothetical protein
MFTTTTQGRRRFLAASAAVTGLGLLAAGYGFARPAADPPYPVATAGKAEPAAKLVADAPLPGPLARGVAIIQFRTENLQIVPVFGPAAATITPRIGHLL